MKIRMACFEDGLDNIGFRKIAAYVKQIHADTDVAYVPTGNVRSLIKTIIGKGPGDIDDADVHAVASFLAEAELVGLCSMTQYSTMVVRVIEEVRRLNPDAYIVWGGIHAIIHPEDAILYADAVCTGEGEFAFEKLIEQFKAGESLTDCRGFWFQTDDGIRKNMNLPLMQQPEMDDLPLLLYQDDELIFEKGIGFRPIAARDFIQYTGLSYNTVWSIGCPLMCTYCGNSKFIEYDNGYRRVRHSSPRLIIEEIKQAVSRHPHISTIVFHDDSFMALPTETIEEFASLYKAEIGLPFAVFGVIPNYVAEHKMDILLKAGLNRVRMGVQSGSERIMEFYKRPTPMPRIEEATRILNKYKKYMIPPAFDIILENPIETVEDTRATIDLLYNMPRPYTLNVFALRVIPNTTLAKDLAERGYEVPPIDQGYLIDYHPTIGNILVFLLVVLKPPRRIYEFLRARALPVHHEQKKYPAFLFLSRSAFLIKRALDHLRFMDFSVIPGNAGYLMWKTGIIGMWQRHLLKRY